jgi:hypothetical protein
MEGDLEAAIQALLGAEVTPDPELWRMIVTDGEITVRSPPGYQPFLPCPLWGEVWTRDVEAPVRDPDETDEAASKPCSEPRRKAAKRKADDGPKRDPLALNRFEKILAMAEMVNVDRPTDEDDDEHADKAADDLDEITIGKSTKKPASKFRFDLDLPPKRSSTAGSPPASCIRNGTTSAAPILRIIAAFWRRTRRSRARRGNAVRRRGRWSSGYDASSKRCGRGTRCCGRKPTVMISISTLWCARAARSPPVMAASTASISRPGHRRAISR